MKEGKKKPMYIDKFEKSLDKAFEAVTSKAPTTSDIVKYAVRAGLIKNPSYTITGKGDKIIKEAREILAIDTTLEKIIVKDALYCFPDSVKGNEFCAKMIDPIAYRVKVKKEEIGTLLANNDENRNMRGNPFGESLLGLLFSITLDICNKYDNILLKKVSQDSGFLVTSM